MGFVLPYDTVSLDVADIAPILDAYPELSDSIQNLLEERFDYDDDDTWTINLPEVGFEATLQSESVEFNFKDNLAVEVDWSEKDELNLEWSIDSLSNFGADFGNFGVDSISQSIKLYFDLINISANAEISTEADGESMNDEAEFSVELEDGWFTSLNFKWDHQTDNELFTIAPQTLDLEINTSSNGDCDFSDNGMCNADAIMTIDYNGEEWLHTLTFTSKPRIAWITYQIDDGKHFVVGARGENEDGKSAEFQDEGYVSVWYKEFDSKTSRPGKVANNKLGTNVVTFPLAVAFEDNVWPVLEKVIKPFKNMIENFGTAPETIPNFIVYFDLWCEELPDEFGLGEVVEASRFSVWDMPNENVVNHAEEIDMMLMENTFKVDAIPEVWEIARDYVQELFGDEGQGVFEDTYL